MLISEKIAVIPLGICCVAAQQMRVLKPILEGRLQCGLEEKGSFFKWILQNPNYIDRALEKYITAGATITRDDLAIEEDGDRCAYLPETRSIFTNGLLSAHEATKEAKERSTGISDGEFIEETLKKYNHLLDNFRKVNLLKHRIFIISNADVNVMLRKCYRNGFLDWYFDKELMLEITESIKKHFPFGKNSVVFALSARNIVNNVDFCHVEIIEDEVDFSSAAQQWEEIFKRLPLDTDDKALNLARNNHHLKNRANRVRIFDACSPALCASLEYVKRDAERLIFEADDDTCLIWGPYIQLPVGHYEARIIFASPVGGTGAFDVAANQGEVLSSVPIAGPMEAGASVCVRFDVHHDTHNIETRLHARSSFTGVVERITLQRLPS